MILILVNSDVGKKGNIGFRAGKIIEELRKEKISYYVLARGNKLNNKNNILTMGPVGMFCLFINFLRIYFFPKINASLINNKICEYFFLFILLFLNKKKIKLVYLWMYSSKLVKYFKKYKIKILTDISMAPYKIGEKQMNARVSFVLKKNEAYTIKNSNNLICPSKFVQKNIFKFYKKKSNLIHFASSFFYKKKFKNINSKKEIVFCFVGLINERKGINYLLKIWSENPIYKKHKLYLCGRVFKKQYDLIKAKKIRNLILTGFVDPIKYLLKADVFVFPTMMEGSAKAVYEAMSCSLPVITTKEAGSIVDHNKNGILIKSKNLGQLNKAMSLFIENKRLIKKFGKDAYIKSKKYTWSIYSKKVVKILKYEIN
jgi:glycosyltransferase involved in cell wall biosynthesis